MAGPVAEAKKHAETAAMVTLGFIAA